MRIVKDWQRNLLEVMKTRRTSPKPGIPLARMTTIASQCSNLRTLYIQKKLNREEQSTSKYDAET